jgi:hypothetical protein
MKIVNSPLGRGKGRQALGWVFQLETQPTPVLRDRCRYAPPLPGRGFSREHSRMRSVF